MKDLLVNFVGAAVFSIIGIFYVSAKGKGRLAEEFIPQLKTEEEIQEDKLILEQKKIDIQKHRAELQQKKSRSRIKKEL